MEYLFWFFYVLLAYVAVIFGGIRLVVPFMGFRRYDPPADLPPEMERKIREFEGSSPDARAYAEKAYVFVQSRWQAERLRTVTRFPLAFRTDLREIWNAPGYAHCHTINFVYYTLLVRSKFFRPENVKFRYAFLNFMVHQYLLVRIGNDWLKADPSPGYMAKPFGERGGFFG